MSRRIFLGTSGAAATAAGLGTWAAEATSETTESDGGQLYAYVGRQCSVAGSGSKGEVSGLGSTEGGGIDVFRVDMSDGSLKLVGSTGSESDDLNSDGICASEDGRFVYCVSRTPALDQIPGTGGGVSAFAINREDGSLKHLNTLPSMGSMPASVRIDKTNSRVVVGNHGATFRVALVKRKNGVPVIERPTDSATVALFPVNKDGSLEEATDAGIFEEGPAPGDEKLASRSLSSALGAEGGVQIGPACHGAVFDRTERWVIATDNGYDHLYVYGFDRKSRQFTSGKSYPLPPGRSPRHIVAHPSAPYLFMTNESQASVSVFHFDSGTGVPKLIQTIATVPGGDTAAPPAEGPGSDLPAGAGKKVSPTDVRIHPNGKFVYAANRFLNGKDTIAIFSVDVGTGRLKLVDTMETGGKGNREFDIEPSGKYLFTCNTDSDDVISYSVDPKTGKLTRKSKVTVQRVSVITFAKL